MLETRQTIMSNLHGHINAHGGVYGDWRIGVCADQEHPDVPAAAGESLLMQKTRSPDDALAVMAYFVYIYNVVRDKRDFRFGDCDIVYLYKAPAQGPD